MINSTGRLLDLGDMCAEQRLGTGDIQVTLRWATVDDLDVSVIDPSGAEVSFRERQVPSGGSLDVDANADCRADTTVPVENVFWPDLQAPSGRYTIAVNLYDSCGGSSGPVPFTVTLLNKGNTQTFRGVVSDDNSPLEFPFSVLSGSSSGSAARLAP
jgi:uncharacterized protein YfaP (DUF2135 family)